MNLVSQNFQSRIFLSTKKSTALNSEKCEVSIIDFLPAFELEIPSKRTVEKAATRSRVVALSAQIVNCKIYQDPADITQGCTPYEAWRRAAFWWYSA